MSKQPLVFVVILNWNGLSDTLNCLESLFASEDANFQVVVIDNNSAKDELSIIKQQFPEIIPIQSNVNLGFTGGCNLGIDYAMHNGAQYIWLLNNDSIVFSNTLASLIDKMQSDIKIGMISPIIYDQSAKNLMYCGTSLDPVTLNQKTFKTPQEYWDYQIKSPDSIVLWATALLINRETVEQVGFLDDRYFAYYEDTDYSIRVFAHGWKNCIDTDAKVLHGIKDSKRKTHFYYYMARNRFLLIDEYSTSSNRLKNIRMFISASIKSASKFRVNGENDLSIALLSGLWDAYNKRYGEWDSHRQPPVLLAKLVLCHPYFFSRIIKLGLS